MFFRDNGVSCAPESSFTLVNSGSSGPATRCGALFSREILFLEVPFSDYTITKIFPKNYVMALLGGKSMMKCLAKKDLSLQLLMRLFFV